VSFPDRRALTAGLLTLAVLVSSTLLIPARAAPTKSAKTELVAFDNSPFPYSGQPPGQDKPFYDVEMDGRRGHTSPRGGVYWEDVTYSDRRVLLHIPRGFNAALPGVMIVYLHGNMASLERVVHRHQQVPRQVSESGLNAVLAAPQLALNALDSSAGRFCEAGHFRRFVEEAGARLARLNGDARARAAIESLPVILVAYSGGYASVAWAIHHGDIGDRLRGIILLDALYADLDKFVAWIERRESAFFFSAYSNSAREENILLQKLLAQRRIDFLGTLPQRLGPGRVVFLATSEEVLHAEFVSRAWVDEPLRDVLARIPGYPRTPPKTRKR
jgi:hypothetical protein